MKELFDREQFLPLLQVFIENVNAVGGTSASGIHLRDAQGLAFKFIHQASSVWYLLQGTKCPLLSPFVDYVSINVLARSALETCLLFNFIFADPQGDSDLTEFRWCAWRLEDMQRWLVPAIDDVPMELTNHINQLKARIEKTQEYQSLSSKRKTQLEKRGYIDDWHPGWRCLGIRVGFPKDLINQIYSYLSTYSHPGSWGTMQILQTNSPCKFERRAEVGMLAIGLALEKMNALYPKVFATSP